MTDVVSLDDYFNSLNPSKILIGALNELKQIEIPISFFSDVPDSQMAVTVNEGKIMKTSEILTEYGLDALSAMLHEIARDKGFWEGEYTHDKIGNKLALVHSEVTEVLEAIRKNQGSEKVVEEMADVIIRLLDVYAAMRNEEAVLHSLDEVLYKKININKERQRLHGNLF